MLIIVEHLRSINMSESTFNLLSFIPRQDLTYAKIMQIYFIYSLRYFLYQVRKKNYPTHNHIITKWIKIENRKLRAGLEFPL